MILWGNLGFELWRTMALFHPQRMGLRHERRPVIFQVMKPSRSLNESTKYVSDNQIIVCGSEANL
jgi:hypothetical protein